MQSPTTAPLPTETPKPTRTPSPTPSPTPAVETIRVDPGVEYQTMDGIGAASYCFPYADDIGWEWDAVKYVFDELDIAYVRLAPWLGWWETANDNEDPYTINWDGFGTVHDIVNHHDVPYAQYLHERGIELAVGVWDFGAAAWCDTCVDWLANGKPRHIEPELYPEMGESISSYVLHMRDNGVPIPVAEVQNEPDIEAGIQYPSPEALRDAGRALLDMLDHHNLEDVMLHAPNLHAPTDNVRWIEAWLEDEVLRERTVAVSYHTWWSQDTKAYDAIWQAAERYGKPVWATEVGYHEAGNAIMPHTWRTSWHYAKSHYRAIAWSHATRTYIWTLLGNDSAVGKDGERYPMFYVLKHFANYVPPGSVLLGSQADDLRLLPLVFRRPDGRYTAIVLNDNRVERTFALPGDWRALELITTSESAYEVQGDPAQVNGDDGVRVTLPPLSLVSMILE
jgi:O-glycosyl hydrolase